MSAAPDGIGLPVVDGLGLDDELRAALRPGEVVRHPDGRELTLPRYFYRVESWDQARETALTEHFTLHEFIHVDVREAEVVRRWPRHVPCAVTLLAAHLELLRIATGTLVWIAANGGYRSPAHALTDPWSPHGWGTAANVFRIGADLLDTEERISGTAERIRSLTPGVHVRPYGHAKGTSDDHVHLDVGYALLPAPAPE